MPLLQSVVSSLWHSLTTNDRHASYHDRTDRNLPSGAQPSSRPSPLRSVSTPQGVYASPYAINGSNASETSLGSNRPVSPSSPYSPGLRSSTAAALSGSSIALQDFAADGAPPARDVQDIWRRIDRWAEDKYPELYDQLSYGATSRDMDELERELSCTFPPDVRESFFVHDGQERGGHPTGLLFGAALLDCEEVSQEWDLWRTVAAAMMKPPAKAAAPAEASPSGRVQREKPDFASKQQSQPEGAVQLVYAHHSWIPLAKDYEGNNLAVDLAPGNKGKWGQIILFGRDYDVKYVIAKNWASFLAQLAEDLDSDDAFIDDEGNLSLRYKGDADLSYFAILKARVDRHCGKRKKPPPPAKSNSAAPNGSAKRPSPSPTPLRRSVTALPEERTESKLVSPATSPVVTQGSSEQILQEGISAPPQEPLKSDPADVANATDVASENNMGIGISGSGLDAAAKEIRALPLDLYGSLDEKIIQKEGTSE